MEILVPKAPIAGQTDFAKPVGFYYDGNTRIAKPGECCTESFIVAGAFSTKKEVLHINHMFLQKCSISLVANSNFTRCH